MSTFDALDARLLSALAATPRATNLALAETAGVSRNTVQARLNRFDERGLLRSFEHRIDPAALGYPLTAFILITVRQQKLDQVGDALARVPEVLEVFGLSGPVDLLARVVATDADDLYRIAGQILATSGVERTETALTMRQMVDYRVGPLLDRITG
jgi:DNA-binding Lrp family transcriptional regulator